jgi:hypothetical protein
MKEFRRQEFRSFRLGKMRDTCPGNRILSGVGRGMALEPAFARLILQPPELLQLLNSCILGPDARPLPSAAALPQIEFMHQTMIPQRGDGPGGNDLAILQQIASIRDRER